MTPPAPEIGWPPPSNISERLTASRAPLGQNADVVIEGSFSVAAWECKPPTTAAVALATRKVRRGRAADMRLFSRVWPPRVDGTPGYMDVEQLGRGAPAQPDDLSLIRLVGTIAVLYRLISRPGDRPRG